MTNVFKAKADNGLRGLCQIDSGPLRVGKRRRARDFVHFFKALPVRELYFFHQAFKHGHHVTERTPSCLLTSEWVYEASLFRILNRPGIMFRGGNSRVTHVLQKQRDDKQSPAPTGFYCCFLAAEGRAKRYLEAGGFVAVSFSFLRRERTHPYSSSVDPSAGVS